MAIKECPRCGDSVEKVRDFFWKSTSYACDGCGWEAIREGGRELHVLNEGLIDAFSATAFARGLA
jgi:anaerobic ribonucleoside-triphosphate reductase